MKKADYVCRFPQRYINSYDLLASGILNQRLPHLSQQVFARLLPEIRGDRRRMLRSRICMSDCASPDVRNS
jgi:hypothetical protein